MFKFLKEKLKGAIYRFTKNAEDDSEEKAEEQIEEKEEEIKELKEEKKKLEKKEKKVEEKIKKVKEKPKAKPKSSEKKEEKKTEAKKAEEKVIEKEAPKEEKIIEKKEKPKKVEEPEKEIPKEKAKEKKEEVIEEKKEEVIEKEEPAPEPKIKELEKKKEEIKKEEKEVVVQEKAVEKEKKGLFAKLKEKVTKTTINAENFEKLFWDLEVVLLENNVAVEVIEKIKDDLKKNIVENPIPRGKVEETIMSTLKDSITEVLSIEPVDILEAIKSKDEKPFSICFIGVNGSGKTTSIAKLANYLQENGVECVMAAGDTFRAAAIDQLQLHADKLGVKLIKHDYGSDAAAVAFDAIKHAKAKGAGAVLIDTAGRMHSNANLMDEMSKIIRVAKPDIKIFVGESITGNDCIEQAKKFNETVGIDAIILSKADVDEKGGAAISVSYVTGKPIIFIGTGQEYKDLKKFQPEVVLESLGL